MQKVVLNNEYITKIDKLWRASNYLSAAQLYLKDNTLLSRPLEASDVKRRIVGPWGTIPGQNFVYSHLNPIIKYYELDMILISGPGHGGAFYSAGTYLDGSWTDHYPTTGLDTEGVQKFCKGFCFPGGFSSHVAPEYPGSINEGGELGYSLAHAFGAVFDNPNLIATTIIGDGEAETGPLATSWQSNKFLNPITDGAVLPILHLNGYKVSNPTVLSRISHTELDNYFSGCGWKAYYVEGDQPLIMHKKMQKTLITVIEEIKSIQKNARKKQDATRPVWPMIVLRTPKGWTSPKFVDGVPIENTQNAYHAPFSMQEESHLQELENWLRSYKPQELFTESGELEESIKSIIPPRELTIGNNPHANGGQLLQKLKLPKVNKYAIKTRGHGETLAPDTTTLARFIRDIIKMNPNNFRIFSPDEIASNRMTPIYEVTTNVLNMDLKDTDFALAKSGRVMDAYLSEHMCEGWLEGYLLTGRHGTFVSYAAFMRVVDSMISQHAKWLKMANEVQWRADIASLNIIMTSHAWQQDHNGYSHQEPGLLDHLLNKKSNFIRIYLPPDANCLLSTYNHCIQTRNYINAIVTSKLPSPQWLSMEEASLHCSEGIGVWEWASNNPSQAEIVIACAGDVITMEALAAVSIIRNYLPDLNYKFINVVDLTKLANSSEHPHGLTDIKYNELFTKDKPIIFNFHGYGNLIKSLTWERTNRNISIHSYKEEGKISTPFDIRVQNEVDRYHLVLDIVSKLPKTEAGSSLIKLMNKKLREHKKYIEINGIDLPEVLDWKWTEKK